MVTYRPSDNRVVCESSHLTNDDNAWHVREDGVPPLWSFPCEDQEHLHDQTGADVWVIGACRHEHVVVVPLCWSCAHSEAISQGRWYCLECYTAPPGEINGGDHECRVALKEIERGVYGPRRGGNRRGGSRDDRVGDRPDPGVR